jgi:hypothetical protein
VPEVLETLARMNFESENEWDEDMDSVLVIGIDFGTTSVLL